MKNKHHDGRDDLVEHITKITNHAREEISWVRSIYKFVFSGVVILISVGIYFTYQNAHDIKTEMQKEIQNEADSTEKDLHTEFNTLKLNQEKAMADYLSQMHDEVTKRIDAEFATNEIADLVKEKASERIDAIADLLIKKDISEQVTPLREDLLNNIESEKKKLDALESAVNGSQTIETNLQSILVEAKEALKKLDIQSDFVLTTINAENDDRHAFEKLIEYATNYDYPLREQALQISQGIRLKYIGYMSDTERGWAMISWRDSVKPETFSTNEILRTWNEITAPLARAYVDFVWGNTNISKYEKINILHDIVIDSHGSIKAADKAAHILADELNAKYNPALDFADINERFYEWVRTNNMPTPVIQTNYNNTNGITTNNKGATN